MVSFSNPINKPQYPYAAQYPKDKWLSGRHRAETASFRIECDDEEEFYSKIDLFSAGGTRAAGAAVAFANCLLA
jgi:hypothetical protein